MPPLSLWDPTELLLLPQVVTGTEGELQFWGFFCRSPRGSGVLSPCPAEPWNPEWGEENAGRGFQLATLGPRIHWEKLRSLQIQMVGEQWGRYCENFEAFGYRSKNPMKSYKTVRPNVGGSSQPPLSSFVCFLVVTDRKRIPNTFIGRVTSQFSFHRLLLSGLGILLL